MGFGDQLMATGMAKGAAARGKRIAFGDGTRILWDHNSELIFRNNPNIAPPGSEGASDLEWIGYYKGNRIYNYHDTVKQRWVWNYRFKPIPGEIAFSSDELHFASRIKSPYILVEPNVNLWKVYAANKQWSIDRYASVTRLLIKEGHEVRQFATGPQLPGSKIIHSPSFRHAMAALSKASLYIGAEGGLHHAAAALGIPAVVIFGGWIPPEVTGYDTHINLSHGKACGSLFACPHCTQAMKTISQREVYEAALKLLKGEELCGHLKQDKQPPVLAL